MYSTYVISILALVISLIVLAVVVYILVKLDTIDKKTSDNKDRIGRLIRELNIIHQAKRKIDATQNEKLSEN